MKEGRMEGRREEWEGGREGREGRREGRKEGREGGKEGRKEGRKEGGMGEWKDVNSLHVAQPDIPALHFCCCCADMAEQPSVHSLEGRADGGWRHRGHPDSI